MPASALARRCVALSIGVAAVPALAHPLDPLNADEIIGAAGILLGGGAARPGAIFQSVELREPPKQAVLSWRPGNPLPPRQATVFWRQDRQSFRTTVNLDTGTFAPPALIPISDGQLGLTIQEVSDFSFAFSDAAFLGALARRGIRTPAQLAKVFVTPLTAGSFGLPEENKRIVKAQMYYTEGAGINLYARPIEGLQAIMDLDARTVMRVLDSGVVPIPAATHEFDEASVGALTGLRPPLKPIRVTQPQGRNFKLDGSFIEWQKWRLHARFDRRTGPVVSLVSYAGRPVLYQGTLSEIFVPYQDADPNWFYRTYMDAGEFGFGLLASPLKLGLDVPENAVLLDAVVSAAIPDPSVPVVPLPLPQVVGVFERLTGSPAWRHFEQFSGGAYEGRAEVELVVRSIAQVGNYDYLLDWVFTQSGVIRAEIGLTGIDAPKAVAAAGGDAAQATPVAPGLVAPFHSHFFNFRLDLDVDGPVNSFVLGHLRTRNAPGPRKSVWSLEERVLASESEGRIAPGEHGRWKVINPGRRNALGQPTGYLIETHDSAEPLLKKPDYQRAGFIENVLWLTAHDPEQRFAAGDTPNQHPGAPGLPQFVRDNRSLVNRDLVVWLTLGHHHVTVAEDWPVLSRHRMSLELKPANFFDRNPALDLRRAPFEVSP
jgi:primary-amine oxidase